MLPETNFKEVRATLREILTKYCQLNENRVVNGISVRGADLAKIISSTELNSYNLSDVFIVFETVEDEEEDYLVMEENDFKDCFISRVKMELKIYGSACHDMVRFIIATFKDERVLRELYDKGIYYRGITKPTSRNEFINNTLWPRCDVAIKAQIRTDVDKAMPVEYFPSKFNSDEEASQEIASSIIVKEI